MWVVIGLGAVAILIWFFKTCFVYVICPHCGYWDWVSVGTVEYSTFKCPGCGRESTKEELIYKKK